MALLHTVKFCVPLRINSACIMHLNEEAVIVARGDGLHVQCSHVSWLNAKFAHGLKNHLR